MCSMWWPTVLGDTTSRRRSLVREAAGEQHEDLDLALRQAGRTLAPAPDAVTGRAEHGVDRIAVEPALTHLLAELSRGVLG